MDIIDKLYFISEFLDDDLSKVANTIRLHYEPKMRLASIKADIENLSRKRLSKYQSAAKKIEAHGVIIGGYTLCFVARILAVQLSRRFSKMQHRPYSLSLFFMLLLIVFSINS